MKEHVDKEFGLRHIGKTVEIGLYKRGTDEWFGTTAGVLEQYAVSDTLAAFSLASSTGLTANTYDPTEYYVLISYFEGTDFNVSNL